VIFPVSDLKRKSPAFKGNRGQSVKINTVKVDDILDLPEISHFHEVFIKMDVEGFEHKVLLGAEKFFQKLDVRGIIMEWVSHLYNHDIESDTYTDSTCM
jgi:FkbM family methyltransferase